MKQILKGLIILLGIQLLNGCSSPLSSDEEKEVNNLGVTVKVNRKGELYTVNPQKITVGLGFRGNVPPINSPEFISPGKISHFLADDEIVIGLDYKASQKAYPVKIMRWHQVVNDSVNEEPFIIAYDPLSNMAMAYSRVVLEKTLDFKASDKIYNSNPILTDKITKTLWSQYTGEAIAGRLAGQKLKALQLHMTTWGEWQAQHPDTMVLSEKIGMNRNYNENQYDEYYSWNYLAFPVEHLDERLPLKETVYGIQLDGKARAYRADLLKKGATFTDEINGKQVLVTLNEKGIFSARLKDTEEALLTKQSLWFAWASFNPGTEIYK